LTRCDLFFADKAILIEGTTERLLLPRIIRKIDAENSGRPSLSSQYVTVMEVGGAYAHLFFGLLDFLDLRALVITDIDTVKRSSDGKYHACRVNEGERTSNACLKNWFGDNAIAPLDLLVKTEEDRTREKRRIAYQVSEKQGGPCGRSFEDAFILANPTIFGLDEQFDPAVAAYDLASTIKKSAFAIQYAITVTEWVAPRYIAEGLRWLAGEPVLASGGGVLDNAEIEGLSGALSEDPPIAT